jgi:hypothetical protein
VERKVENEESRTALSSRKCVSEEDIFNRSTKALFYNVPKNEVAEDQLARDRIQSLSCVTIR